MAAQERIVVLLCYDNPVVWDGLMATLAPHSDLECTEGNGSIPLHGFAAEPGVIVANDDRGVSSASACAELLGALQSRMLSVSSAGIIQNDSRDR